MKFETFKFMLQAYADQQKTPSSLPKKVDTMAYAYQRICEGEDPWTALGDFSNAWFCYAKHIRPDLIKEPLTKPKQETEHTHHWAAFCAASVEYLCDLHHEICPQWVYDPCYTLETPWWNMLHPDNPEMQKEARQITPPPFARRNIFCSNRLYQNKYEMYEWMHEAVLKGVTDVHEIKRYAKQKEVALYGA